MSWSPERILASRRPERPGRERGDMNLKFFQGLAHMRGGDLAKAEEVLRRAVTEDPEGTVEPAESWLALGIVLRRQRRLAESLGILDKGIQYLSRERELAEICCEAAEVAVELHQLDRARDFYVHALLKGERSSRLQFGLIRMSTTAVALPRPAHFQGPLFNDVVSFAERRGACRMRSFQDLGGNGELLVVSMHEDRKGKASASTRIESAVRSFRERRPDFGRPLRVVLLEASPFALDVTAANLGPEGDRSAKFGSISFEEIEERTGFRFRWTADHFKSDDED